ncbi:glycosyltransferase [Clostridium tertium]|uniref:glycosyltransferase n=1 Tax=Clostridium tertium TaxID=1559 RepID=UPI000BE443E9|nr:glycosyltransferase [Clostridium tertium]
MKKKITFVLDNLLGGGAERVLIEILNNFDYEIFDVELLLLTNEGKYIDQLNPNIKLRYIFNFINKSNININFQKLIRKIFFKFIVYFNPKFIYKVLFHKDSDIVIAFMEGISTKIVSSCVCRKRIAWIHTDVSKYKWYKSYFTSEKEEKYCYNNFDKIICVSDICRNGFINTYGNEFDKKVIKVFNPINNSSIKQKSLENIKEVEIDNNIKKLCYVGRLEPEKGIMRLLKIANEIKNENIYFKLLIVGEGSQRELVDTYIKENNLSNIVNLYGFQENPYKYMNASDIIVSPSYFEGFSLITAEALILNKVVVATDSGGPTEILNNGVYGCVCKNDDIELKNCIISILKDKELFEKYKNVKKDIIKEFEVNNVLKEIYNILEEVDK